MKALNIDDFKNLYTVMNMLEELKEAYSLDEHQQLLSKILIHGGNWRLRERVLEYSMDIQKPTNEFLEAICCIVTNDEIYINLRILAVEALRILAPKKIKETHVCPRFKGISVLRILQNILESPQVPLFHDTAKKAKEAIDRFRNNAGNPR
ncbi:MAG TPA: hypothetical protein PK528_15170 [Syntrophorhabdus sp.]|nr:hypothetical protein [Syntrophorhabdus sp.]